MKVTLKGTKGPIKGFKISSKNKLMGVLLRFSNEGEQVYDDPLPNGTLKLVGGGTGKQASLIPLGGKNPCKNPTVKLKQGQSKNVCIAFEMPKNKPSSSRSSTSPTPATATPAAGPSEACPRARRVAGARCSS